jgi:hypothetical protein
MMRSWGRTYPALHLIDRAGRRSEYRSRLVHVQTEKRWYLQLFRLPLQGFLQTFDILLKLSLP